MPYQFKETNYELTQEEQEKAKFIMSTVTKWKLAQELHRQVPVDIEIQAFERFKTQFYRDITKRLGIDCDTLPNGLTIPIAMAVIEGGKIMVHCEVVKHVD